MPRSLSGARAAFMNFVNVRGDDARPNGRPDIGEPQEPPVMGKDGYVKYASFRSNVTNQSSELI